MKKNPVKADQIRRAEKAIRRHGTIRCLRVAATPVIVDLYRQARAASK